MWETWVWYLGWEDPQKEGMATYSSMLAWGWTEVPGGLQSMGSQRVRHSWVAKAHQKLMESTCQSRRLKRWGFDPWVGKTPGVGNSNPLLYSCLENSMGRGAWQAVIHGTAKSWTQLSNWVHTCEENHLKTRKERKWELGWRQGRETREEKVATQWGNYGVESSEWEIKNPEGFYVGEMAGHEGSFLSLMVWKQLSKMCLSIDNFALGSEPERQHNVSLEYNYLYSKIVSEKCH